MVNLFRVKMWYSPKKLPVAQTLYSEYSKARFTEGNSFLCGKHIARTREEFAERSCHAE